jgi:hypothetical protein
VLDGATGDHLRVSLSTGLLLAALPLVACALFAWAIWKYGDEYADWSVPARALVATTLLALGVAAAGGIGYSALTLDRTLVAANDLELAGSGLHVLAFEVRQAGRPHRLHLIPKRATRLASGPVTVRGKIMAPDGHVLTTIEHRFEVHEEAGVDALDRRRVWREHTVTFVPSRAGPLQLRFTVPEGNPPRMGILVNEAP